MRELVVVLPKDLKGLTNSDDLETKLFQAVGSLMPALMVRTSKMTSNKVCLNLTLDGYMTVKTVEAIKIGLYQTLRSYFGDAIKKYKINTTVMCTLFEEVAITG